MIIATVWIKEYGSERHVKCTISEDEITALIEAKVKRTECSDDAKLDVVIEH
jgi:hypothetical protein